VEAVGVDPSRRRQRIGSALYRDTNPVLVANQIRGIEAVLADLD